MESSPGKSTEIKQTRDLDRTRSLILDAAIDEFAQSGMQGARVEAIARKAGVNKAMIYYIFGSKQELYIAALELLFEEKTKGVDPPPRDAELIELLSNYFDAFVKNPAITQMMLHDVAGGAEALRELKRRRPDLFEPFAMVSNLLKTWMDEGKILSIDTDKAVALSILIIVALVAFIPHFDLARDIGTPAHKALSDLDSWKLFIGENVLKLIIP